MDGIIVINKSKKYTSHDVVAKVKKVLNISKVGHTGTLDPNATGVLPILLGKGTRLSKYLINHDKKYVAILKLGEKRDTADSEGIVIEEKEIPTEKLNIENINLIFKDMIGKQKQIPPMYSAIKINGKKLYEYARDGKNISVPEREIEIYDVTLLKINDDEIVFEVKCSKGTYIRTLCEDIAKRINTVGYMKELQRVTVGEFDIKNSITIEELEENKDNIDFLDKNIIKFEELVINKDIINLNNNRLKLFLNGVNLNVNTKDEIYRIYCNDKFIGTGIVKNKLLKRDIIL